MSIFQPTDEQRTALEQQIASRPAERRIGVPLTKEQVAAYRQAVEEEQTGKEDMIAHVKKLRAAEQEPGLFGDLRRAINASRLDRGLIAERIGATADELEDFRTATASLAPEALSNLVATLGLRLMQEIPSRRETVAG